MVRPTPTGIQTNVSFEQRFHILISTEILFSMEKAMDEISLQQILTIITWILFICANLVPIVMIVIKAIKSRRFETDDLALKLFFFLYFLSLIGYLGLNLINNPSGWRLYVLWGALGLFVLTFFFCIALLQIRMVRGKGALKRFFNK